MHKRFAKLFAGLNRAHGEYTITGKKDAGQGKGLQKNVGKARTVQEEVTETVWERHITGQKGLGVVPINDKSTCIWGAIDIDVYDIDIKALERQVQELGLKLVCCKTKSGGVHAYQFCSAPVPAPVLRNKLKEFAIALGYMGVEIFPKQDKITSEADSGNWINMPYFDAANTTRYAIKDGEPLSAEEFLEYAETMKVSLTELKNMEATAEGDNFSDGPPCLQHYAQVGFPQGTRNNALFSLGVYARRKYPDDWAEKVFEYNTQFMGPGTYAEVSALIKSLGRKVYAYKCADQPLCQACNKQECKKREFGVGPGKKSDKDGPCVLDEVDKPIKCYIPLDGSDDEPQWVFNISGKQFDVSVDMISDQRRFLKEYLKKFHRIVLPIKDIKWMDTMNELLADAEIIELPPDAGPEGQFWLHLEQFCTGKIQAKTQSELLLGKPWTDEGRTYFRSKDLMKYLDQQHFKDFKEKQIWSILRRKKAGHHKPMIKGVCVGCWSVEEFARQTEDFEKATFEGEPF